MKFLILSADQTPWSTLPDKVREIKDTINSAKNADWEVYVQTVHVKQPKVVKGRIATDWLNELFKPYFTQGFDSIGFHFSKKQKTAWKIQASLRGANPNTPNEEMGNFYFWADESTLRDGFNQFVQTCLHEFAHEYYQKTGLEDMVHVYHHLHHDIKGLFNTFDFALYQPYRQLLQKTLIKLRDLYNNLLSMTDVIYPVEKTLFIKNKTQDWLNPDKMYKSGVHNGTDIAVPLNTPILAPADGKVYHSGITPQLGFFCFFECQIDGRMVYLVFPHLVRTPYVGDYKKGQILGRVGNTGLSTGPHVHLGLLITKPLSVADYVRLVKTKEDIIKNTLDPYKFFLYAVERIIK